MAVVEDVSNISVSMKLNNGTRDGSVITESQSLGKMDIDRYDNQKAMNIVNAAQPILAKEIYEVQKTNTYVLSNSD